MIGGPHESFEYFTAVAGGVQNLIQSFQAGLQQFRKGGMPRILGNSVTREEIESAQKSNLKFGAVENLVELLGDDGMFEEHETDDTEEVVQNYECCGEEITLSPQDTAEAMGDALQFQNMVMPPFPALLSTARRRSWTSASLLAGTVTRR